MKRLLCLLGFHDWLRYASGVMAPESIRTCRRCGREEIVVGYKTKTVWAEYKREESKNISSD